MNFKRYIAVIALVMVLVLGLNAAAEVQYIMDIQVSARALDGSTPEPTAEPVSTATAGATPELTPEPTAEPDPEPTPEPIAQASATPEPTPEPAPTPVPEAGTYEIEVDLHNQIVTVYRAGGRTAGDIARQMICSSGTGDNTPTGTFIMPEVQKVDEREEWYYIGKYRLYVQYASRIVGSILFHSLPSETRGASPTEDSRQALGERASHGCIRLRPADSRWIAENCAPGTQVYIYEGAFADEPLRTLLLKTSFDAAETSYDEFLQGKILLSVSSELPEVTQLQAKLNELGYGCGETDGLFGAQTHNAVVYWQQENGHRGTGELNEQQLEQLLNTDASAVTRPGRPARVQVDTALILRSAANSQSARLDTLPNGTLVRVLDETGGWYKISVNGKTGYAGRNYIAIME